MIFFLIEKLREKGRNNGEVYVFGYEDLGGLWIKEVVGCQMWEYEEIDLYVFFQGSFVFVIQV